MMAFFITLAFVLGCCVAMQGTLNAALAEKLGTGGALLINTAIVAFGSVVIFLVLNDWNRFSIGQLSTLPWYLFLGGVCGFLIILLAIILFPRLGAGPTLAIAIAAQLIAATIIDHLGLLGIPQSPISVLRIIGILLLVAGATIVKVF